jgi:hypothetical protein
MNFSIELLRTSATTIAGLDDLDIDGSAILLGSIRDGRGRLFICGSGGSLTVIASKRDRPSVV